MKNIANVRSKKHHKFLVTAVCIATLGAQFTQITNVKAEVSSDSTLETEIPEEPANGTPEVVSGDTSAENEEIDLETSNDTDSSEDTDTDTTANVDEDTTKLDESAPIINDYPDTGVSSYKNENNTFSVYTTAKIQVTNENGTDSTPTNANIGAGADIIDNPDNQYEIVFTVENNEGTDGTGTWPSLLLPRYYENDSSTTHIVLDPDNYDEATLLKNAGLPKNTVVQYGTGLINTSYDMRTLSSWARFGGGLDLSEVTHIYIDNSVATGGIPIPDGLHTLIFPLKVLENDPVTENGIEMIGTGDMSTTFEASNHRRVAFHIVNAPEPEEPEVDPNKEDHNNKPNPTTDVEFKDTDDLDNDNEDTESKPETTAEDTEDTEDTEEEPVEEEPIVSPNEPILDEKASESEDTKKTKTDDNQNNDVTSQNDDVTSQNDALVYHTDFIQSNSNNLQGYTMNKVSELNTNSPQDFKSELLPQAGNENNSKIQLMGMTILAMVAGIFGIDLKKKHQNFL